MKTTGIILILLVATLAAPLGNSFAVPISNSPTNLVAQSVSSTQINLSWSAPVNATQNAVNGYKIDSDVGCLGTFSVLVANQTGTTYNSSNLKPSKCYAYKVFALNSAGASVASDTVQAATQTAPIPSGNQTKPTDNLGQKISEFVQKRNDILKKQREETLRIIQQCHDKAMNTTGTARKQTMEECRKIIQELKAKYKDTRKQFQEEFKTFREDTKSLLKEAKKSGLISKEDVKDVKRELKGFEKDSKKETKDLRKDIKELRNDLKKELKEHKKNKHHDDDDHDDDDHDD